MAFPSANASGIVPTPFSLRESDYLPITVASTATVKEKVYQGIYRSASDDGEGCIEIRGMDLSSEERWNVWESVTEEDGLFGGICWGLLERGYISVATASRVYFFHEDRGEREYREDYWTRGKKCLIFEVDVFLEGILSHH